MMTYISILRGINVGGQRLIKMDALRKSYEKLGFQNVTTYVQSGNVIFGWSESDVNELEQKISRQIEVDFGFEVPVIVLTLKKLEKIIVNNPFVRDTNKDIASLHVTFLSAQPGNYDSKIIEINKQIEEEIFFSEDAIYLYCPNGYGKTKLTNNFLESKLKVAATTRNWKSTNELLNIALQLENNF